MNSTENIESAATAQFPLAALGKDTADVWSEVLRRALISTSATGAAVALRQGGGIVTCGRVGASAPDLGSSVDIHNSFAGLCLQTGRTLNCGQLDGGSCVNASDWSPASIVSMIVTPLFRGETVIGVVAVFSHRANAFLPDHTTVLEKLAAAISAHFTKPKPSPRPEVRITVKYDVPAAPALSPRAAATPPLSRPKPPAAPVSGAVESRERPSTAAFATPKTSPQKAAPATEVVKTTAARVSEEPRHILRFKPSERMLHWSIAIPFLVCLSTALVLVIFYNPHPQRAYRVVFSIIHRISGVCLFLFPTLTALWHRRDHRIHFHNIKEALTWVGDDVKWLFLMGVAAVNKKIALPEQGKFNAAEKLNFIMVLCTYPLFIASGVVLSLVHFAFLAWILHVGMAAMAAPLVFGHIFMATINPETRVGLSGMLSGYVDRHWARHHYTRWYRQHFENDHGRKVQRATTRSGEKPAIQCPSEAR